MQIVGLLVGVYLFIGVVVALLFVWRGAALVDPRAKGATLGFRIVILPGCVALWPVLLKWWRRGPQI